VANDPKQGPDAFDDSWIRYLEQSNPDPKSERAAFNTLPPQQPGSELLPEPPTLLQTDGFPDAPAPPSQQPPPVAEVMSSPPAPLPSVEGMQSSLPDPAALVLQPVENRTEPGLPLPFGGGLQYPVEPYPPLPPLPEPSAEPAAPLSPSSMAHFHDPAAGAPAAAPSWHDGAAPSWQKERPKVRFPVAAVATLSVIAVVLIGVLLFRSSLFGTRQPDNNKKEAKGGSQDGKGQGSKQGAGASPKMTLVVAPQVPRDYATIGEALAAAQAGMKILVKPGEYREGLVLDKLVEIIGDGAADKIVIACSDAPCVTMKTEYAVVRGVSLRGESGKGKNSYPAVRVPQGSLVLDSCDITSDAEACVAVQGPTSNPVLRDCKIRDGRECGLQFSGQARGTVENCVLSGNVEVGVVIQQGSNPVLQKCEIQAPHRFGVHVHSAGQGMLINCTVKDSGGSGVLVELAGRPVLRDCAIRGSKQAGLLVHGANSVPTVEKIDIEGSGGPGIEVRDGASPLVRKGKIRDGKTTGVFVGKKSAGTLEDCEISRNPTAGVQVVDGSPILRNCSIQDGVQGVVLDGKCQGTFHICEISGSRKAGLTLTNGSHPELRDCKIHTCGEQGVVVEKGSKGTFNVCEVYSNGGVNVEIRASDPLLRGCKVRDGKTFGVLFEQKARGTLEHCHVLRNREDGVEVREASNPLLRGCYLYDGQKAGLRVQSRATGTVDDCQIYGNQWSNVIVKGEGDPRLIGCRIYDSKTNGVFVLEKGRGRLEKCEIRGSPRPGVISIKGGHPTLQGCHIHHNTYGVRVGDKSGDRCGATILDCTFHDNSRGTWSIDDDCLKFVDRRNNRELPPGARP
jgi:F-box protein 11